MSGKFTYIGSSYLFLIKDGEILLQRRFQTGFMDGYYGVPAGHLDGNETAREGCAREIREEVGITVKPEDLEVVQVMHRKAAKDERIDFFMTAASYTGEIQNCEPHKCDDLRWFALDTLPDNMVDYVKVAVENYTAGIRYAEFGF
jgi:ADP-ribose pyrophosphatase YjhB (NUDIX family)